MDRARPNARSADTSDDPSTTISDVIPPPRSTTTTPAPGADPTESPLLVGAVVVAGLATALALWRAVRGSDG